MQTQAPLPSVWVVTEGLAGTENQCLGVAEALGVKPVVKRIALREPWRTLTPWLGFEGAYSFDFVRGDALQEPWPDVLIAAGRKAVAAARYVRKASGGKTFTVFLQDPRILPSSFDLVAVPQHDRLRGENVIVTVGAPNRISAQRLDDARVRFEGLFSKLPSPRVAVLIGGDSHSYTLTEDVVAGLVRDLEALARQGAGLMITASRRTPAFAVAQLRERLAPLGAFFAGDVNGSENPYIGMLAWADAIIVTAESVSMMSDAASTGKPVYLVPLEGESGRLERLHDQLLEMGIARAFEGVIEQWSYEPLRYAKVIAEEIQRRRAEKAFGAARRRSL